MKIELEFTDPKDGLPEEDGYYLIYGVSMMGQKYSEEVSYFNGIFEDNQGSLIPKQNVLLWAKMPSYDEIMKKE